MTMIKILCLLYSACDFGGMLWTGYHSLFTIVSFWVALAVFYALASWSHYRGMREYRHILRRAKRREEYR